MALRHTLDLDTIQTNGQQVSRLFSGSGGAPARAASSGPARPARQASIMEMYHGGARTLISY